MPDSITLTQKILGRLSSRELFAFRPEYWGRDGIQPDSLRERQTRLGRLLGVRLFSRRYPGVFGRVHIHESMLQNDSPEEIDHYRRVGESAIENIERALRLGERSFGELGACLDMACGYGRVLRHLVRRIEPKRITACEVMEEAIRFCAAEFGVKPLLSRLDLRAIPFERRYDLIWVGSLFTHLPIEDGLVFLDTLLEALEPGGILVFSTQGPDCLDNVAFYGFMFADQERVFQEQMERDGAAYLPYYANEPNYGIAFYSPEKIERHVAERFGQRFKLLNHTPRGWDAHQDIWAFQRPQSSVFSPQV